MDTPPAPSTALLVHDARLLVGLAEAALAEATARQADARATANRLHRVLQALPPAHVAREALTRWQMRADHDADAASLAGAQARRDLDALAAALPNLSHTAKD